MKTLTFGIIPSFDEFKAAFDAANLTDGRYLFQLNTRDADMLYTLGLRGPSKCSTAGWTADSKLELLYTAEQLYSLLTALVEVHNAPGDCDTCDGSGYVFDDDGIHDCPSDECNAFGQLDSDLREWAGQFASAIMSTLGFDWV